MITLSTILKSQFGGESKSIVFAIVTTLDIRICCNLKCIWERTITQITINGKTFETVKRLTKPLFGTYACLYVDNYLQFSASFLSLAKKQSVLHRHVEAQEKASHPNLESIKLWLGVNIVCGRMKPIGN